MEYEFKRDLNRSFLILNKETEKGTMSYQEEMLVHNRIPGLLACEIKRIDSVQEYHYDITGLYSLEQAVGRSRFTYEQLRVFLLAVEKVLRSLEDYLLANEGLLLQREFIYVNQTFTELFFCFFPDRESSGKEEFHELSEFIVKNLDHREETGITLGYELYKKTMDENYSIGEVIRMLEFPYRDKKENTAGAVLEERSVKLEAEEPGAKSSDRRIPAFACAAAVFAVIYAILLYTCWVRDAGIDFIKAGAAGLIITAFLLYVQIQSRAPETTYKQNSQENKEETAAIRLEEEYTGESTVLLTADINPYYPHLRYEGAGNYPDFVIDTDSFIIGKQKKIADAVIDSAGISRIHCKIIHKKELYYLIDLDSTNGTFLNGRKLLDEDVCLLNENDNLRFADITYRWSWKK